MLLKRLYDTSDPDKPVVNGVQVLRAGLRQHFSPDMIAAAQAQGWIKVDGARLTLKAENATIEYRIERGPGYYCCFCRQRMPDGIEARVHIGHAHKVAKSPDPNNPAGYERIHYFDCVRGG